MFNLMKKDKQKKKKAEKVADRDESKDEISKSLIDKIEKSDLSGDSKTNIRQSISLPNIEQQVAKVKAEAAKKKKTYSLWDFVKFTLPFLWKGGIWIRIQTVLTFILLFISRGLSVTHPLILKFAIDSITC